MKKSDRSLIVGGLASTFLATLFLYSVKDNLPEFVSSLIPGISVISAILVFCSLIALARDNSAIKQKNSRLYRRCKVLEKENQELKEEVEKLKEEVENLKKGKKENASKFKVI